jgi:hypothetical protein
LALRDRHVRRPERAALNRNPNSALEVGGMELVTRMPEQPRDVGGALHVPHVLIEPTLTIVHTGGRVVDDPWGVGSQSRHDEPQLKVTYQF